MLSVGFFGLARASSLHSKRVVNMSIAQVILDDLKLVDDERAARTEDKELDEKVSAIKSYQQQRFRHTYFDLLSSPRYGPAAHFFLNELYGPDDFRKRDEQFARVVPVMVRLFPKEVVETVASLAQLHALSERLDTMMGRMLKQLPPDAVSYRDAWRATGGERERARQIDLTLSIARALDRLTRKPLLRKSLSLMRQPARAAGLGELQQFLETGFDTFKVMSGAGEFVALVEAREKALVFALFGELGTPTKEQLARSHAFRLLPP